MSTVGLTLALAFLLCGAGAVLGMVVPERRVPALLAWSGSLAALSALWAAGIVLSSGGGFHHQLWTIPSVGTLTVSLDRLSALFLGLAAVAILASSIFSASYLERYLGHSSSRSDLAMPVGRSKSIPRDASRGRMALSISILSLTTDMYGNSRANSSAVGSSFRS